jgi:hypothetical protein
MKPLELINMQDIYSIGDLVVLKQSCRTKSNNYKKDDMFLVEAVKNTVVYLRNEKGGLTIHRFLNHMIEKAPS